VRQGLALRRAFCGLTLSALACQGSHLTSLAAHSVHPSVALPSANASEMRQEHVSDCIGCHEEQRRDWDGSMHHASFTSADFQESWGREPLEFCVRCHAPERATLGALGEHRGIGCTACHQIPQDARMQVAKGDVAARKHASLPKVGSEACTHCHEFSAPESKAILQSTVREHAESSESTSSCIACHMPLQDGTHNHAFSVSRNRGLLAQSLEVVSVARISEQIVATVRAVNVGHRFPTGDIFRRVYMHIAAIDEAGARVCEQTFHFNRDWEAHARSLRTGAEDSRADTRLTSVPRALQMPCANLRAAVRVEVSADYSRGKAANADYFAAFEVLPLFRKQFSLP
jgi:Cytochrome c554 and c-prime